MRVVFDHHFPFALAHGGFQIQIERTLSSLRALGIDADWFRFWDDQQRPDLIHFFGRPSPGYIEFAKAKNIRVVFSELLTGLGSRKRWQQTLHGLLVRSLLRSRCGLARRLEWTSYGLADGLISLTDYEARLTKDVFCTPKQKIHVIPNGVDDVFFSAKNEAQREEWLICTAVIHPRKRVAEFAEAAAIAGIKTKIYGRPYSETDPYFEEFLRAIKRSGGIVEYGGPIDDRNSLAGLYRQARAFVLASTMESLSLSALEATASGCPLILSRLPWATTTFGDSASYLPNTSDVLTLAKSLTQIVSKPLSPPAIQVLRWTDVAERLVRVYQRLLS